MKKSPKRLKKSSPRPDTVFGIYCNVDWYQTMISSSLKKYDFWIARYPASDDGWMKESLRPDFGVGWQYSSKARIPGISGYVDRDVFYKDYADENTSDEIKGSEDEDSGEKGGAENLWERTRRLMAEQTGYLEKRSDKDLDSKTANAGVRKLYKIRPGRNLLGASRISGTAMVRRVPVLDLRRNFRQTEST